MPANMPPTVEMHLHSGNEQKTVGMISEKVNESILEPPSCSNDNVSSNALQHMQQVLAQTQATMETRFEKILDTSPQTNNSKRNKGKPKSYGCKQCGHVSTSKYESWQHVRTHISADKLLNCPKCDFVTEYKNHLEYHLKNHVGSKPFKCKKCNYSCVNRSMLNSHMKSHSSYYQYRCRDCTYTTKYCHSMKLHLRNYGHQQAIGQLPIRQRHRSEAETDVIDQIQQQSMMQRSSTFSRVNPRKAADESVQTTNPQNAQTSSVTTQPGICTASAVDLWAQSSSVTTPPGICTASAVDLWASAFICNHCDIAFRNSVMYNIHMGYHDYENPFKCNRCGTQCNDSLDIFIHIAQVKH